MTPSRPEPVSGPARDRYAPLAVFLHWTTAALVLTTLVVAVWLELSDGAQRGALIRFHKSVGLTILALSLLRIAGVWGLRRPAPLPVRPWEQMAAHSMHAMLYVLLVAVPLSGWAMISADDGKRETYWFGWLHIPKLAALVDLPPDIRAAVHSVLQDLHLGLAVTLVVFAAIHVGAVAKHERVDRMPQLGRMSWSRGGLRRRP